MSTEVAQGDQSGLGRLISIDDRDKQHPMRRRRAPGISERYWWTPPAWDQGKTPHCVAYAGVRYLMSGPIINKSIPFETLYEEAQDCDEWPGNDYEGTSTRGLMKALVKRGLVGEYQWAFDAATVVSHLLSTGPVLIGTQWTDETANPTIYGYITVGNFGDEVAGGHEWCAIGANRKKRNPDGTLGAVRAVNSWGVGWGNRGRFWVTFGDLDKLMKSFGGEACVATEINHELKGWG